MDRAVLVEHRAALRLSGVGGEDRLHTDAGQVGRDLLGSPSLGLQAGELVSPEAALRGKPLVDLTQATGPRRGVCLDDVEKLEGDRVCLLEAAGSSGTGLLSIDPGKAATCLVLAEFLEHLVEAGHQFPKITVDLGEAVGEVVGFHEEVGASLPQRAKNPTSQSKIFANPRGRSKLPTWSVGRRCYASEGCLLCHSVACS